MHTVTMTETEIMRYITLRMIEMGVPAHLSGYTYLREAILLSGYDMSIVGSVTKLLYPEIARIYRTSPSKVERSIRNAIEISWNRGKLEVFDKLFGYSRDSGVGRPTNSEYIARVADHIRLELLTVCS